MGRAANPQANVFLVLILLSLSSPLIKTGIEAMRPAAEGPGAAPASATVQPIINKITCPVLTPNPYACRGGRCPAEGR